MTSPLAVDIFAEDRAHEEFLKALLLRLASEEGCELRLGIRAARGGHGKALDELDIYQRSVSGGFAGLKVPDLLCIGIDANCKGYTEAVRNISKSIHERMTDRAAIACPDPHIERWYLADPISFTRVVGAEPDVGKTKCDRDRYKKKLANAVIAGGSPLMLGGIEYASEIVEAMDLYRACSLVPSLKHFVDSVRRHLARLR